MNTPTHTYPPREKKRGEAGASEVYRVWSKPSLTHFLPGTVYPPAPVNPITSKTASLKPQAYKFGQMLCCGFCCGNMSKRDYKVATTDGIELEPLGGEKSDKDKDKEKQTNGVTFGK